MDLQFLSQLGISHSQTRAEARLAYPPITIGNWIDGEESFAQSNRRFLKLNPRDGKLLAQVTRSASADVNYAVKAAHRAARSWDARGLDSRAGYLLSFREAVEECFSAIAEMLSLETARAGRDTEAEVQAALDLMTLMLSESRKLGSVQSASQNHVQFELGYRTPKGVVAAIHSGSLPFLHFIRVAFSSLITGNTLVWKPSMSVPCLASFIDEITRECCFPDGVINTVHGSGAETGQVLASHPDIDFVEFTGSSNAAQQIFASLPAGREFIPTLSGAIPIIVCEDANLKTAARTAARSVFDHNRFHMVRDVFVYESVFESFRDLLIRESYRYQSAPLISERKLLRLLGGIDRFCSGKSNLLSGGYRLMDDAHRSGYYLAPTVIEHHGGNESGLPEISAPLVCIHPVNRLSEIISQINRQDPPPSIVIHTRNHDLAREILNDSQATSVIINGCAEEYAPQFSEKYLNRFYTYTSVIRSNDNDETHPGIR
jgi:acyl-CoA reductase-like NAD-dependent aldehyde dehydrogenase